MVENYKVIAEYKKLKESLKSINYFRYVDAVDQLNNLTGVDHDYNKLKLLVGDLYHRELERQNLNIFEMDVLCGIELFSYFKKENFTSFSKKETFMELVRLIAYKGKSLFHIKYDFDPYHVSMDDAKNILEISDAFITNYIYFPEEITYITYYIDPDPVIKQDYNFPIPDKEHIDIKHGTKLQQIESYFYTHYNFLERYFKLIQNKEICDELTAKLSLLMGRFAIYMPAYYYYNGLQINIAMVSEILDIYKLHDMNTKQNQTLQSILNEFIAYIEFSLHFKYKRTDESSFFTLKDANFYLNDASRKLIEAVSGDTSVWAYHSYVKNRTE